MFKVAMYFGRTHLTIFGLCMYVIRKQDVCVLDV
jgi:hypothetical protein